MNSIADSLETPVPLLRNSLVVVSNRPMRALRDIVDADRIAIGDPSAVPAGVYAREALQREGIWNTVLPRLIPCENVRAALLAVESGVADAAIVYATDARLAKHTRVAMTIDSARVTCPIAVVRGAKHADAARRFVEYCRSDEGMRVFAKYGFAPSHVARTLVRAGGMNPAPHFG